MDDFNPQKAIDTALAELEDITSKVQSAGSIMYEIASEGVGIVKDQMQKYGIPTDGDLGNSVKATRVDAKSARLEADGGHATFVEFGTGIIGQNNPHEEAEERGISYDRNSHSESGWVYFKDGRFFRTKGQPSRPFWYSARSKIIAKGKQLILNKLGRGEKK